MYNVSQNQLHDKMNLDYFKTMCVDNQDFPLNLDKKTNKKNKNKLHILFLKFSQVNLIHFILYDYFK